MKKHYIYLVKNENETKFKCGYTSNPRNRAGNYITHDPTSNFIGYMEIPNKNFEKLIHMELKKRWYRPVNLNIKKKTEWFEGNLNLRELYDIIKSVKDQGYYE